MTDPVSLDVHTNPEAHDPDGTIPGNHRPATQAIESALIGMPNGTRTVEAKAAHIHAHLNSHGWAVLATDKGAVAVLGPDEQVITVPDGYVVDVRPLQTTGSYDDSELDTMASIVTDLEALAPDARERVAVYLTDRYGPTPPPTGLTWPAPAHVTRNGPGFTDQRAGDWTIGGGHA